ncbi:MAG: RepB family DNA primase, partial [Fimbriimonadaceae bacterium]|nr:RepB family DNA primase [Alphaproteobacteria bacterium]
MSALPFSERIRLTHDAVKAYIRAFPLPFLKFDVRCIRSSEPRSPIVREYSRSDIDKPETIKYLRAKNATSQRYDIFIAPITPHVFYIDLDKDGRAKVDRMIADDLIPVLIVETSPDHYQAWFIIHLDTEDASYPLTKEIARIIAERYGCDMGAIGQPRVGRLPGFYNRKKEHRKPNGNGPLVRIRGIHPG